MCGFDPLERPVALGRCRLVVSCKIGHFWRTGICLSPYVRTYGRASVWPCASACRQPVLRGQDRIANFLGMLVLRAPYVRTAVCTSVRPHARDTYVGTPVRPPVLVYVLVYVQLYVRCASRAYNGRVWSRATSSRSRHPTMRYRTFGEFCPPWTSLGAGFLVNPRVVSMRTSVRPYV
jgi:hypothetical protein